MASYPNQPTARRSSVIRCINLDWLEVFAHEPQNEPHDLFYFQNCGYSVRPREYGTRVYLEMFTILTDHDEPLLEVRRNPASQGLTGIHDANACHIRLCNRSCYFDNAADFLLSFLSQHGYYDIRISRVDLCLDFSLFDFGDNPYTFILRYFKHKYSKINQSRITGHGSDTWLGQQWNSVSWGSKSSQVSTKMYNKTLELYDPKTDTFAKPYIREAWFHCGLIDNIQRVTKDGKPVDVWRVEFSLRSSVKNWLRIEIDGQEKKFQSIRNTLEVYSGRERILTIFAALTRHYFRFKKFKKGQRKDRCEDKLLFDFSGVQEVYKLGHNSTALGSGTTFKARYQRLMEKIKEFQATHTDKDIYHACDVLISAIVDEDIRKDQQNPWSWEELETMKQLIRLRTLDKSLTYDAAMIEVKKLLKLNERTLPQNSLS